MLRAQLRRRVPAPDVYLRDDLGCGLAGCPACAGGALSGAASHVVLPTAETLAWFLELIEAASGAACGDVLVLRSALAAAARHRLVRRSRELHAFVSSASRPHQRVSVLEDVFHRGASALCDQLVEGLARELALQPRVDAAAEPPAPAAHDASSCPPSVLDDAGDDLLASLLADVDMLLETQPPPAEEQQPSVSVAAAAAAAAAASTGPPSTRLPCIITQERRLQCRSVAAAVWLAQHWRGAAQLGGVAPPLVVVLVPDEFDAGSGNTGSVDALTALAYAAADADPGLVVNSTRAGACLASDSRLPGGVGGVAVLTLSQYLASVAPQLAVAARSLHPQSTSLALRGGDGAAVTRHDEGAKLAQLSATLAALAEARATAIASAAARSTAAHSAAEPPPVDDSAMSDSGSGSSAMRSGPASSIFPPHCTEAQVTGWLQQGFRPARSAGVPATRLVRGTFKRRRQQGDRGGFVVVSVASSNSSGGGASVPTSGGGLTTPRTVVLPGPAECNRALDGDIVVVELTPPAVAPLSSPVMPRTTPLALVGDNDAESADPGMLTLSSTRGDAGNDDDASEADVLHVASSDDPSKMQLAAAAPRLVSGATAVAAVYGRVICILRRRSAPIVATVVASLPSPSEDNAAPDDPAASRQLIETLPRRAQWVLVTPMDVRLPRIRLRSAQVERLVGHRILVTVDGWHAASAHPDGHYVSTIGRALDVDTEVRCVMLNTHVHTHVRPFPPAAVLCLPALPASGRWSVAWDRAQRLLRLLAAAASSADGAAALQPLQEHQQMGPKCGTTPQQQALLSADSAAAVIARALAAGHDRRDLRWSHDVCSVDPPGCTDIDDALHARELAPASAGCARRLEVGVHIADVTCFVHDGSALDLEARARGTTVYLVDRRLDMLPKALSENVCSLRARVDRYAFSVIWELEEGAAEGAGAAPGQPAARMYRVVPGRTWVGRTIIRSTHALTYYQAKRLVAGGAADEDAGAAALALAAGPAAAAAAAAAAADSDSGRTADDPLARDLSAEGLPLPAGDHVGALDPTRSSPEAAARLAREARLYPADPPEGGICGAPVHPDDHARLRESLTLLTQVSRWLARARGVAGSLDFERGEMRFVLRAATAAGGGGGGGGGGPLPVMGASGVAASDGAVDDVALPAASLHPLELGPTLGRADDDGFADAEGGQPAPPVEEPVAEVTTKYQEEIHTTIAELMIFANQAAAKLCVSAFPSHALLRHHPPADTSRFGELQAAAAAAGFTVDTSSNGALQRSLHAVVAALTAQGRGGPASSAVSPQAALLRQTALWAMTRAAYFATTSGASFSASPTDHRAMSPADWTHTAGGAYVPGLMDVTGPDGMWHYGLAIDVYTHFTSPIRRYADDVVHKLLAAALQLPSSDADIAAAALHGARHARGPGARGAARAPAPAAGGPRQPRPLPASATPSVAGLIDWSLGDRPAAATLADAITTTAPDSEDEAMGGGMALLDSLLLPPHAPGSDAGGGGAHSRAADSPSLGGPVLAPLPTRSHGSSADDDRQQQPPFAHDALEALAGHLNERNQAAKVAGWECDELFLALYLRSRVVVTEAVVSEVAWEEGDPASGGAARVQVYVPRFQCAAPLHLTLPPHPAGPPRGLPGAATAAAAAAAVALPPALLVPPASAPTPATGGGGATGPSDVPPSTAVVLSRLPPAVAAALVREGALRMPVPRASCAVQGTALRVHDAATGGGCTLAVMDRVCVAVTCDFDVRHARRPRIIVDLLAETPGVRALLRQPAHAGGGAPQPPPSPPSPPRLGGAAASTGAAAAATATLGSAAAAGVAPAATPSAPRPVPAPAEPAASLYVTAVVALQDAEAIGRAGATALEAGSRDRRRRGGVSAPPAAGRRRATAAAPAARTAAAAGSGDRAIARGRGWYGGYEPPPALRPQDWHEGQAGGGDAPPVYTPFAGSSSSSSSLQYLGASIGWQAPPRAGSDGARAAADPARPGPRWAAGAGEAAAGGSVSGRVVFGGAPPDTSYVGRLHGATEASAYGSKSGAGMASLDLLGSYGGLRSAERDAMARYAKLGAGKRHDRIDKAKRAENKGK